MAEVYRSRAEGFAGTVCRNPNCKNYSRWAISTINSGKTPTAWCQTHSIAAIRDLFYEEQRPVVVQEVPGNWGMRNPSNAGRSRKVEQS